MNKSFILFFVILFVHDIHPAEHDCHCETKKLGYYCGNDKHLSGNCAEDVLYKCYSSRDHHDRKAELIEKCAGNCVDAEDNNDAHCEKEADDCTCTSEHTGHYCGDDEEHLAGNCDPHGLYMCENKHHPKAKFIEICGGIHHCIQGDIEAYCDEYK